MFLNASFPDHPTRMVEEMVEEEVEEEEEEEGEDRKMAREKEEEGGEDGLCRQVQPDGKIKVVMCDSSSSSSNNNKRNNDKDVSSSSTTSLRPSTGSGKPKPSGSITTGKSAAAAAAPSLPPPPKKTKTKTRWVVRKHPDGSPYLLPTDSTCEYRGGVDWTIYSVYKIDCGCSLPQAMADGKMHRIQLKNTRGKVQVAGLVLW